MSESFSVENIIPSEDCDDAWEQYINNQYNEDSISENEVDLDNSNIPKCSDIYISTKTKIAYLNKSIDLKECFWKIKVLQYYEPNNGVIKKQIKYNFKDKSEVEEVEKNLKNEPVVEQQIISKIDNPEGKIKYKDIRKISVGLCKKDILSYRSKKKSAFYNCFVLILRINFENEFKESHVKVFNTGKLELPGIQNDEFLKVVLTTLVGILNRDCNLDINFKSDKSETVLINSNFSSNFFIDREKLVDILKSKYHLNTTYDPCSYPGIMSKFYYNCSSLEQNGIEPCEDDKKELIKNNKLREVSFMIFRTGSVLIVGKCEENTLMNIYEFLKEILQNEYINIRQNNNLGEKKKKIIRKKVRRKTIFVN